MSRGFWELLLLLFNSAVRPAETGERRCRGDFPDESLASATSWVVLRLMLGNNPLFHVPQYQLVHPLEFAIYTVLGVAGGLVSVAFTKLLLGIDRKSTR